MMKTVLAAALICSFGTEGAFAEQPNIIFMLADDLGYGDLSCYNPEAKGEMPNNTPIRTPNLDRMAELGARYTDFHSAAPICSPPAAPCSQHVTPIVSGSGPKRTAVLPMASSLRRIPL